MQAESALSLDFNFDKLELTEKKLETSLS